MNLNLERFKQSLHEHFSEIEDPRQTAKTRHKLLDIITIAILAVLCGADNWVAVVTYGEAKQDWLKQFLELPNGIPSHDTFGQLFSRLDPEILEARFRDWMRLIVEQMGMKHIALDGKTVRGSYDRENKLKALQLVSAYCSDQGLILGQCAVDEKSNEITAIPELLEKLAIKGAVVTADALNTQKSIASLIQEKEADYILALKGNHKQLAQEVRQWWEKNQEQLQESGEKRVESGHHRLEKRQTWAIPAAEVISPEQQGQWSGLKTIVIEKGERNLWNKKTKAVRFFLSSLPSDSEEFAGYIRHHWSIENQLHWCLDVIFREDASRIREGHSARNMSLLRRLTLNILRQDKSKGSLTMKRYKAGLNNNFLVSVLLDSVMF
jgi:predicted transposase YbfD/YdcC